MFRIGSVFFDTGCGNFIALKRKEMALVIDCGETCVGRGSGMRAAYLSDLNNPFSKGVTSLLSSVDFLKILETHLHDDHCNLETSICGIWKILKKKSEVVVSNGWNESIFESYKKLDNPLGNDVEVILIKPENWCGKPDTSTAHHYNCMVKIRFNGRTILFPGDVSPQLFMDMRHNPMYFREFKDVDFLVLPHHGSNANGELMVFDVINPEMVVCCANPKESLYNIPWEIVGRLRFDDDITEDNYVNKHDISVITDSITDSQIPVFVTCDAAAFYKLIIGKDHTVTLYNGFDASRPLFKSNFSIKKQKRKKNNNSKIFRDLCEILNSNETDLVALHILKQHLEPVFMN